MTSNPQSPKPALCKMFGYPAYEQLCNFLNVTNLPAIVLAHIVHISHINSPSLESLLKKHSNKKHLGDIEPIVRHLRSSITDEFIIEKYLAEHYPKAGKSFFEMAELLYGRRLTLAGLLAEIRTKRESCQLSPNQHLSEGESLLICITDYFNTRNLYRFHEDRIVKEAYKLGKITRHPEAIKFILAAFIHSQTPLGRNQYGWNLIVLSKVVSALDIAKCWCVHFEPTPYLHKSKIRLILKLIAIGGPKVAKEFVASSPIIGKQTKNIERALKKYHQCKRKLFPDY